MESMHPNPWYLGMGFTDSSSLSERSLTSNVHTFPPPAPISARANLQPSSTSNVIGAVSIKKQKRNDVNHGLSPSVYIKTHPIHLTSFEKTEISRYPEIYYTGRSKKIRNNSSLPNNAFDDDKGDYKIILHDHIAYRYEILGVLGKGSFGQVIKVLDHKYNKILALKTIRNKHKYHQQALIELKLLDYINKQDPDAKSNMIHMIDSFYFRNHFCLTFDLLSMNLYEYLKLNNFNGFPLPIIRKFAIQILNALSFLSNHHVIHCDLKPENILLNDPTKSLITVIDVGSSCFSDEAVHTYIQSRFYRAPEVILGVKYTTAIDMWSFGCVLAELLTGYPIFPGENEADQLACIMEIFGLPPDEMLQASSRNTLFFKDGQPRCLMSPNGHARIPGTRDLEFALGNPDDLFINFIKRCFNWIPSDRMTPIQALDHPWITQGTTKLYDKPLPRLPVKESHPVIVSQSPEMKLSNDHPEGIEERSPMNEVYMDTDNVQMTVTDVPHIDVRQSLSHGTLQPLLQEAALRNNLYSLADASTVFPAIRQ